LDALACRWVRRRYDDVMIGIVNTPPPMPTKDPNVPPSTPTTKALGPACGGISFGPGLGGDALVLLDRARRRPMEMHRTQLLRAVWFTCRTGKLLVTWDMETIGQIIVIKND